MNENNLETNNEGPVLNSNPVPVNNTEPVVMPGAPIEQVPVENTEPVVPEQVVPVPVVEQATVPVEVPATEVPTMPVQEPATNPSQEQAPVVPETTPVAEPSTMAPVQEAMPATSPVVEQTPEIKRTAPDETIKDDYIPAPSQKTKIVSFVLIALIAGGLLFGIATSLMPSQSASGEEKEEPLPAGAKCVENVKFDGYMSMGSKVSMSVEDVQYDLDSSKTDTKFIMEAYKFDDVVFKVCYTPGKAGSVTVGESTEYRNVERIELYDANTLQKLKAKDVDSLLKELGYHAYGTHTEKAKVISIDTMGGFGYGDEGSYIYHDMELQFSNNKVIEARYKVFENQQDRAKQIEKNKEYTFTFTVEEDVFNPIAYTITDFK